MGIAIHAPQPSLIEHLCGQCGARDSDPTWHRQPVATVSPRREPDGRLMDGTPLYNLIEVDREPPPSGPDSNRRPPTPDQSTHPGGALPTELPELGGRTDSQQRTTAVARRTDPSTSWEAARSVGDIRRSQNAVLSLFSGYGPMTDEEAWARYEAAYAQYAPNAPRQVISGFRTRRSELVKAGLLRDTGERRKGSTGRSMIVWEAA